MRNCKCGRVGQCVGKQSRNERPIIAPTYAFDTFTVSDIRIDGLSRIAPGTVFTYLSVEKGDS